MDPEVNVAGDSPQEPEPESPKKPLKPRADSYDHPPSSPASDDPDTPEEEPPAAVAEEPDAESANEPDAEPAPEPDAAPAPEPDAEPAPDPDAEPAPDPDAKSAPEPDAESAPVFDAEAAPEPDADTAPEADAEPPLSDTAEPDSLEDTVGEYVESTMSTAAFAAGVKGEHERVQSLIYNLVDKVKQRPDGGESATAADSAASAERNTAAEAPAPKGVPYGDQRAYSAGAPASELIHELFWMQNSETVTLTVVLDVSPPPASARDVTVVFGAESISVLVRGACALREDLAAGLDADACLWSLDRSKANAPALTLELEKSTVAWWPTLFKSHDPSSYRLYQSNPTSSSAEKADAAAARANSSAAEASQRAQVPAPPPPQAQPLTPTADARPPDAPPPAPSSEEAPVVPSKRDVTAYGIPETPSAKSPPSREDLDGIISQYRTSFDAGGPGAAEAALQLATFYHHGIGVERDVARAARLFRFALEHGVMDNLAAFQLGLIYNQGCPGLTADPKEAVRWWLVSAKLGNAVAMFNLGVMFMKGSGCVMDPQTAMQFFTQAHAINPKLRPPEFTPVQLAERVTQASKLKKLRQKAELTDEERKRRHDQAMETLRYTMYGTAFVVGTTVSAILLRNWWKNRL